MEATEQTPTTVRILPRKRPTIGQRMQVHGIECVIYEIHDHGTVDVEATDGTGRCWRVTGLGFRKG